MAFVLSDRIKETTTTTSTGTYTLGGAVSGFETFTANLSNGDTTYYCCTDGTDFEVGLGTFTSSGTTLARTTIISSSNSNNAVNWSSGSRDIFCTLPGSKAVFKDGSDNINGTFVGNITGNVTGNTSGTAATVTGAAQSNITSVGTLTGLTTSGTINLSQTSGTAITTSGSLSNADLGILRAHAGVDTHGFTIKYMGSRSGNNNSYALFMDNQAGTDVEAMTVLQDGKVGINNTSPSAPLDVSGDAEITGTLTAGTLAGTLSTAAQTNITSLGTLTSLTVDDITINGSTISDSGDFTLDVGGDISFDAAGNDFKFLDNGTEFLRITNSSSDAIIRPVADAKDIIFQQRDGTEVARVEDNGTFNVVTDKLALNGTAITSTATELNKLDGVTATTTELNYVDVTTLGTVQASKAVTADANGDITSTGDITSARLRLTATNDASLSSTNHAFQSGSTSSINIIMDGNEILARNNGSASQLNLNTNGGTVKIGDQATADLALSGDIELGHDTDTTIARASAGVVTIEGNTIITTGNSDTPSTTTSSSDADFVLVDDGGTMKKITPSNLGITSGGASKGFAVAMAIAL